MHWRNVVPSVSQGRDKIAGCIFEAHVKYMYFELFFSEHS